jgi:protein gp37
MGAKTTISYADHTFSPWLGCAKQSPGCANCFAERWARKFCGHPRHAGKIVWGPVTEGGKRLLASAAAWAAPLKWEKALAEGRVWVPGDHQPQASLATATCEVLGKRIDRERVLTDLCDPFDEDVPLGWLARYLRLINETPHLDWLVLTKRPGNIGSRLHAISCGGAPSIPHFDKGTCDMASNSRDEGFPRNAWLGVSVENQEWLDRRAPKLLQTLAFGPRWVSLEPLLGPIDFNPWLEQLANDPRNIGWVVVGGMTGPGWRRWLCEIEWIEGIAAQCNVAGVPLWVKQDSGPRPGMQGRIPDELWEIKQLPKT